MGEAVCPTCGMPMPAVIQYAPFCPYCGQRRNAPAQAPMPMPMPMPVPVPVPVPDPNANADFLAAIARAKAARGQQAQADKPPVDFTEGPTRLQYAFDPRVGVALFGPYAPDNEPARLRAFDLANRRVAWEALSGEPKIKDIDRDDLAIHAGVVYAYNNRVLHAVDLYTGQPRWRVDLPDEIDHHSGLNRDRAALAVDPTPPGGRGVLWAMTTDHQITAIDRDNGHVVWREAREGYHGTIQVFDPGRILVHDSSRVMVVDPASRAVADKIEGRIERLDMVGTYGVVQVDRWGWRERDGLLVHDFAARKELMFEHCEHLEDDVPSVLIGNMVYAAVEYGAKVIALPKGKPVEPLPGYKVRTMVPCGNALIALCEKAEGTSYRRVIGLGLPTLTRRFDLGEMNTSPGSDFPEQLCSNGHIAVFVNELQEGEYQKSDDDWGDHHALIAVDQSGRQVWKIEVRDWEGHWFCGPHLVVMTEKGWHLVRPDDGAIVATGGAR